ncbi:MAG: PEP-CTERM/exosortase system-associated acyltransferase [Gammaproteobacteria bacterium]
MSGTTPSLTELFLNYFDIDLVTTDVQRTRAGRVRYQVYCKEFGYEPAANFPDRCERDPYDDYSVQCLVTHRRSQLTAGCSRLIFAAEERPMAFEDHCRDKVYLNYLQKLSDDRDRFCECSRLAVDSNFRKHPKGIRLGPGEVDHLGCCRVERKSFSLVGVAAVLSVFSMARHAGRNDMFAMMDSNLPRLLRQMGILVEQAGDPMEYHGERTLYYITTEVAVGGMRDDIRALYDAIHARLAPDFQAEIEACVA